MGSLKFNDMDGVLTHLGSCPQVSHAANDMACRPNPRKHAHTCGDKKSSTLPPHCSARKRDTKLPVRMMAPPGSVPQGFTTKRSTDAAPDARVPMWYCLGHPFYPTQPWPDFDS
jgi:hypothetical protein